MKIAIVGVDSRVEINNTLLSMGKAFETVLPSFELASERLTSCFRDFGKQFSFTFDNYQTSRRQIKRAQMRLNLGARRPFIFSEKPSASPVDAARKRARMRHIMRAPYRRHDTVTAKMIACDCIVSYHIAN